MSEICAVEVSIELDPTGDLTAETIEKYRFQTKNISFSTIIKMVSDIFSEIHSFSLVTDSYLSMRQCIFATVSFNKVLCVKVEHLKHQTDFYETIINVEALKRCLQKIYCNVMTQKYVFKNDCLAYFFVNLRKIVDGMRRDHVNNLDYIKKYVANIKTIDYIKECKVADINNCIDVYYMEKTKSFEKFKLYREFLSIRKNRKEEINYYLAEKERCEKKKIIC